MTRRRDVNPIAVQLGLVPRPVDNGVRPSPTRASVVKRKPKVRARNKAAAKTRRLNR